MLYNADYNKIPEISSRDVGYWRVIVANSIVYSVLVYCAPRLSSYQYFPVYT